MGAQQAVSVAVMLDCFENVVEAMTATGRPSARLGVRTCVFTVKFSVLTRAAATVIEIIAKPIGQRGPGDRTEEEPRQTGLLLS